MRYTELMDMLAACPVVAAVHEYQWEAALQAPPDILFYLDASLLTVKERVEQAHKAGKKLFVHMDLADGIGKDKTGVRYLAQCGADGIISTKAPLIRMAKELNLLTVQRFFLLDSQGMDSISDMLHSTAPHLMEIMPGVISKALRRFGEGPVPVIAGGLLETKAEVTTALSCGAAAVSTSMEELWYL
ncbi:MAG: glycerol-3-phosphate responsive antiterminator [Oscillospiraceae bacterium]|nr:glycerol-3-phosphate responsive antiterminator [Oscillospiraceae bacterium]